MSATIKPTDYERLKQILAEIETDIAVADPVNNRDEKSFEYERGVLITVSDAELVARAIKIALTMTQVTIGGDAGKMNPKALTRLLSKAKHAHTHPKAPRRRR